MLFLRDFKGTERFKKSNYLMFADVSGNIIENDDKFLSEIAPVLHWKYTKDGGAFITLAIYDEMPQGYKIFKDAPPAPYGYEWIYNGKSVNSEKCIGLLKNKNGGIKL